MGKKNVEIIRQEWVRINPDHLNSFYHVYKKTQGGYIALCNVEQWCEGGSMGRSPPVWYTRHKILEYSDLPQYSETGTKEENTDLLQAGLFS